MISAPLFLAATLLLGPPEEVITPTQPQPGEPAIAPAQIEGERAVAEPEPLTQPEDPGAQPQPGDVEPAETTPTLAETAPGELPSWQADPNQPATPPGAEGPVPFDTWETPGEPPVTVEKPPPKGWALWGPAFGIYGAMLLTQPMSGYGCGNDVYCGTRGWPWRFLALPTMGLAAGGGVLHGRYLAWKRVKDGQPAKNPIARRAAGWSMFILGFAGLVTDTTLYQLCYDGQRGPYFELEGFRYTCSPVISVVTLNLSTLVGATGLGLAVSAESQIGHRRKLEVSFAPFGGRGQAGLSVSGQF